MIIITYILETVLSHVLSDYIINFLSGEIQAKKDCRFQIMLPQDLYTKI